MGPGPWCGFRLKRGDPRGPSHHRVRERRVDGQGWGGPLKKAGREGETGQRVPTHPLWEGPAAEFPSLSPFPSSDSISTP